MSSDEDECNQIRIHTQSFSVDEIMKIKQKSLNNRNIKDIHQHINIFAIKSIIKSFRTHQNYFEGNTIIENRINIWFLELKIIANKETCNLCLQSILTLNYHSKMQKIIGILLRFLLGTSF